MPNKINKVEKEEKLCISHLEKYLFFIIQSQYIYSPPSVFCIYLYIKILISMYISLCSKI